MLPISYEAHLSAAWYPLRPRALRSKLQNLQNQAKKNSSPCKSSDIKALLVPHAGYEYSGAVATSAYQNISPGTFKRVIILAPSHHNSFSGVALPGKQYDSFKNVVGKVALDTVMLKALRQNRSGLFVCRQQAHESEHAIEVQIPLIQKYCGLCKIVPLLIGSLREQEMQVVAQALQPYLDDRTLLIATSDLTHYGTSFGYTPFTANIGRQIVALDDRLMQQIQKLDAAGFMKVKQETGATVCGAQSIALLLKLLTMDKNVPTGFNTSVSCYITDYDRSSGQDENPEQSVSYVGMVFVQQK